MTEYLSFKPKANEIPTDPGVYRWFDKSGRVLYVGKAKNLRARLSSYFAPLASLPDRTRKMVTLATDVQWTIVKTEFEALQLEFTWIKEFNPPYNVQFRDDKSYPYLAISMDEEFPRVFVTRNRNIKGNRYFGPYTQAWAVHETLDTLLKVYPIRTCSNSVFASAKRSDRPCLLGDIGKCSAPCVERIDATGHKAIAKKFADFLSGTANEHIKELKMQMEKASNLQQFEFAGRLRDQIAALETVLEKSAVVLSDETDADVFGIAEDNLAAAVSLFKVRSGRIRGVQGWVIDKELERDTAELLAYILQNTYDPPGSVGEVEIPKEVLVPIEPDEALKRWLEMQKGARVELRVAKRGDKAALSQTAETNAKHSLQLYKMRRVSDFTTRGEALASLQASLGLAEVPLRIECIDISHLGGTGIVGSLVVFEDGLPKKSQYRRFAINQSTDDTDSIYQVVSRRLKYLNAENPELLANKSEKEISKFAYRPSLLIVDGGLPQVNAAQRALSESGLQGLSVIGLAKRLEEVWVPNQNFPLILPRATNQLFLLQKIRDEAHRFAISYQRKTRSSSIETKLGEIPGLGEKRISALLKKFGSVKRLSAATLDEIAETAGIGQSLAREILEALNLG